MLKNIIKISPSVYSFYDSFSSKWWSICIHYQANNLNPCLEIDPTKSNYYFKGFRNPTDLFLLYKKFYFNVIRQSNWQIDYRKQLAFRKFDEFCTCSHLWSDVCFWILYGLPSSFHPLNIPQWSPLEDKLFFQMLFLSPPITRRKIINNDWDPESTWNEEKCRVFPGTKDILGLHGFEKERYWGFQYQRRLRNKSPKQLACQPSIFKPLHVLRGKPVRKG